MSSLLQIRDVPEEARRGLKARAAARGQSLNAYLLDIIERETARPTVAEVLDRAAQRAERANASAAEGQLPTCRKGGRCDGWTLYTAWADGPHLSMLVSRARVVTLADDTQFAVATGYTDAQRNRRTHIGSVITFRYQELIDRSEPRFSSLVRVRTDASVA